MSSFMQVPATVIPQRYVIGILGLFALANAYTMRVCLSMTITQMVARVASEEIVGDTCPDDEDYLFRSNMRNETMVYTGRDRYDWNESTQGFLLSAFYYGYVLTHIPGGLLAEKFGGKWTIGISLLCTSIATILTPWAVTIGGATGLFIIRMIEGAGEGPVTPGFILLLARWVPPAERSRFGAMIFGGAQIGNIFGPFISGLLLADGGDWANVFYVFGGLGVIWFIFWALLCFNTPNSHPFISEKERNYLNENIVASGLHKKLDPVPFKALLRSAPLWALVFAAVGHDWGYFTMITDLPKYISGVLKFNIKDTGFLSALPYLAMYPLSFIFAGFCDMCIRKDWHSITTGRKIYTTVSSTLPAIFIILASYSGCDGPLAVTMFVLAMSFMAGFYSSVKINAMDIAPNYAGTCSAMVNGLAAFSGIITPYLFGLLTPDQTVQQWRLAFWTVFAVLVITNIAYLIWGSGKQQWWDDVDKYGYPPGWKHGPLKKRTEDPEKKVVKPKHDHSPISDD
ncbi:putative inorganic phosphate cotransporter isoform X1 [Leptidea sinapis]|uniref:putative inorganic phosphate cotransporter isoform X1 n=1 Tax=Leptidea sinapis TaxID=189913 RepID=UPI0021C2D3F8|nr:putative inorganic phosphate cotransporter isoform X1 [Leptidea sinapis]